MLPGVTQLTDGPPGPWPPTPRLFHKATLPVRGPRASSRGLSDSPAFWTLADQAMKWRACFLVTLSRRPCPLPCSRNPQRELQPGHKGLAIRAWMGHCLNCAVTAAVSRGEWVFKYDGEY